LYNEYSICLEQLYSASAFTLPRTHVSHPICVAEFRKFGMQQVCPLCRAALPPGPEKLYEEATRKYTTISSAVKRGDAPWSALPPSKQHELQAVVADWKAAADQGYALER